MAMYCSGGQKADEVTVLKFSQPIAGTTMATSPGDVVVVRYMGMVATHHPSIRTYVLTNVVECSRNEDESTYRRTCLGSNDVMPGWELGVVGMGNGEVRYFVVPQEMSYHLESQGGEQYVLLYSVECVGAFTGEVVKRDSIRDRLSKYSPARMLISHDRTPQSNRNSASAAQLQQEGYAQGAPPSSSGGRKERSNTELEIASELGSPIPQEHSVLSAERLQERLAKLDAKKRKLKIAEEELKRRERELDKTQQEFEARTRYVDIETAQQVGLLQTEVKKLRRELAMCGHQSGGGGVTTIDGVNRTETVGSQNGSLFYDSRFAFGDEDFPSHIKMTHYLCSLLIQCVVHRVGMFVLAGVLVTGMVISLFNSFKTADFYELMWLVAAIPSFIAVVVFHVRQRSMFNIVGILVRQFSVSTSSNNWDYGAFFAAASLVIGSLSVVMARVMVSNDTVTEPITFVFPSTVLAHVGITAYLLICRQMYVEQCSSVLSKEIGSLTTEYAIREVFICMRHLKQMLQRAGTLWNWYFVCVGVQAIGGLTLCGLRMVRDNFVPSVQYLLWDAILLHISCVMYVGRGWLKAHETVIRTTWVHFEAWAGQEQRGDIAHKDFADMMTLFESSRRYGEYAAWRLLGFRVPEWISPLLFLATVVSIILQIVMLTR
eukprot:PhF_6_TR18605/c0_g2_i1/m.27186